MKLALATTALPLAAGYMGGFNRFGRPMIIGPSCSPQQIQKQKDFVDRAFSELQSEIDAAAREGRRRNRRDPEEIEQSIRQQQDWINRAFGLANEVASEMAGVPQDEKTREAAARKQQEWVNKAFGFASDAASGFSTPRYEVRDKEDAFTVIMDIPGVKPSDLDVSVSEENKQQVLKIEGSRTFVQGDDEPREEKFSKSFPLDSKAETDKITAKTENGVLTVSAPKKVEKKEKKTTKIPIIQAEDEEVSTERNDEGDDEEDGEILTL